MKVLLVAMAVAVSASAQTAVTNSNPYLRMCTSVARPTLVDARRPDSLKRFVPDSTPDKLLCFRKDTVKPAPVPVPVPAPAPTGWTLFTELEATLPPTGGFRIAYDASSITASIDPAGQPALAMQFPAGYTGGASPAAVYYETFSAARVRLETRVAYPIGYQYHAPSGVDKQVFLTVGGYNSFFTMMYGGDHVAAVGLQGLASSYLVNCTVTPTDECKSVNLTQNMNQSLSAGRFVYGRAHRFDCEIATGSAGTVNCWFDGVQIISYSGIPFRAGGASAVAWVPIWGGAGGSLPAPQSVYLGRLAVYR
jgi:hypothetical protein